MATRPPIPGWVTGESSVTIGGTKYTNYDSVPDSYVDQMAHWLIQYVPDDAPQAQQWLNRAPGSKPAAGIVDGTLKNLMVNEYIVFSTNGSGGGTGDVLHPPGTPGGNIPGIGNPLAPITDTLSFMQDIFAKLTDPQFWLRVGEVLIGLLLLGIGLEKLTDFKAPGPIGTVIHSGADAARHIK